MECPKCKVENPPDAVKCGCEHDFQEEAVSLLPFPRRNPAFGKLRSAALSCLVLREKA
jgi:hypothetical protein